jgi:hypothetical protein
MMDKSFTVAKFGGKKLNSKIKAFGTLIKVSKQRYYIEWIDGSKNALKLEQLPVEMFEFVPGQSFDAVVLRNLNTWKLIRIESVSASSLPEFSEQEMQELLFSENKNKTVGWD